MAEHMFVNWTTRPFTFEVTYGGQRNDVRVPPLQGASPGVERRSFEPGQRLEVRWQLGGANRQFNSSSPQKPFVFLASPAPGGWFELEQ